MIKVFQLNIQTDNHLHRFIPYLEKENADILCLQEVCEKDVSLIKQSLGFKQSVFQQMSVGLDGSRKIGVAIFTKFDFENVESVFLGKEFFNVTNVSQPMQIDFYLLKIEAAVMGEKYTFATTHFPVTVEGSETPFQNQVCEKFLQVVEKYDNLVVTGDFNAPRGRKVFGLISQLLTDNVPANVTTTIDQNLHRKKGIQFVVDGFFTKDLSVREVDLQDGLSDHMAITGRVAIKK